MKKTTQLRHLLERQEILVAPGAHDAITARVIESLGFDAVYMTGYGQAASVLGQPDIGLLDMSEMVDRARKISACISIPVIADGDTGFGNAITVMRTVNLYEAAGVAAIQLEDQIAPKRCGHMLGRAVIRMEEMVGKIEAAAEARKDKDFVIIARTDARTDFGIDEAIKRAQAYEKAGADIIFVESVENEEEMRKVTSAIKKPCLANMVEGGRTPLLHNSDLQKIGYKLVIYPTASIYVTTKAMMDLMQHLKVNQTTNTYLDKMITFPKFNELVGLGEFAKLEDRFVK